MIVIFVLLLLTGGLVGYISTDAGEHVRDNSLRDAVKQIKYWTAGPIAPIGLDIQKELQLDEYINQEFIRDSHKIFLYIGYYHTARKVGAAHDPLVCFPGQGWKLGKRTKSALEGDNDFTGKIRYSSMITEKGANRQLLLYWFQSYDVACANTLSQKVWLLWKKLKGEYTDNAFVRITVPISDQGVAESRRTALEFVRHFYPVFLEYITSSRSVSDSFAPDNG